MADPVAPQRFEPDTESDSEGEDDVCGEGGVDAAGGAGPARADGPGTRSWTRPRPRRRRVRADPGAKSAARAARFARRPSSFRSSSVPRPQGARRLRHGRLARHAGAMRPGRGGRGRPEGPLVGRRAAGRRRRPCRQDRRIPVRRTSHPASRNLSRCLHRQRGVPRRARARRRPRARRAATPRGRPRRAAAPGAARRHGAAVGQPPAGAAAPGGRALWGGW